VTVNVASPAWLVVALTFTMEECPLEAASVTAFPAIGSPLASESNTSIVALVLPSAGTLVGMARTTESATAAGGGGGVPKVTET
jgi:hypothetical protein